MKMVKSLLLGSAAGTVAIAGAQAADLPVKAKPVEYVKICSLYGAGFYYIPGTDICMKIGGYVRYQVSTGVDQSISFGPFNGTAGYATRHTGTDVAQRVRVWLTNDTRQQTAYGTLRTYFSLGWTHDTPNNTTSPSAPGVYFNRGFIQFAGFTFGKSTSFFDFASTAAVAYNAGFVSTSDTGDPGQIGLAYTAQLGNGVSATISMEQSRRLNTVWTGEGALFTGYSIGGTSPVANLGSGPGTGTAGVASRPDFVANIRVDQAWGSAQLSGAIHDVTANYYGSAFNTLSGHPDDEWGWAAAAGLRLNAPMIGPGDYFQAQFTYSEGAVKYASNSSCIGNGVCDRYAGAEFAFGILSDAQFSGTAAFPGDFNLTTAWSIYASYEHFWTPSLRTSIYGSYADISHNDDAKFEICGGLFGGFPDIQCNPDFRYWAIGSRTQWDIVKDFYVGVDVIYARLETATINNGNPIFLVSGSNLLPSAVSRPSGFYRTTDQDALSVTWRVQRSFVP
jgi:hypothetical protein